MKVKIIPTEEYFPHMAQAHRHIGQYDQGKARACPKVVSAALRGMKDIMDNPEGRRPSSSISCPDGKARRRLSSRPSRVCQIRLSGAEETRRSERRAAGKAAGFLPGEGPDTRRQRRSTSSTPISSSNRRIASSTPSSSAKAEDPALAGGVFKRWISRLRGYDA